MSKGGEKKTRYGTRTEQNPAVKKEVMSRKRVEI